MTWHDITSTIVERCSTRPLPDAMRPTRAYADETYVVMIATEPASIGPVDHLMIRRHDGQQIRSWSDLQRIKDELGYADRSAVEIFPPASELVDHAPLYHLWVMPDGFRLPFGRLDEYMNSQQL